MKKITCILIALVLAMGVAFALCSCGGESITLTFISDGEEYGIIEIGAEETLEFPKAPEKEGYDFLGWYYDDGVWEKPATVDGLLENPLTESTSVYAYFVEKEPVDDEPPAPEKIYCTVTFDSAGGSEVAPQTVEKDTVATEPPIPTKSGYEFKGWYIGEIAFMFQAKISSDMTLTARWEVEDYSITYILGGGTAADGNPATYTTNDGDIILFAPKRNYYTFGGWYENKSFEGEAVSVIDTARAEDITLYAKWTLSEYSITYNLNGGTAADGAPESYTARDQDITLSVPTRVNYTFGGWYENENLEGNALTEIDTLRAENITLYAKWTAIPYSITYRFNGGATTDMTIESYTVEDEDITLPIPTRANYTFGGWYESESLTGDAVTVIDTARGENITLYAKWTAIPYSITYHFNGGATTDMTIESYTVEDEDITLPIPTRANYTFGGWYESESLTGNAVTVIDTARGENITLHAKWTATPYSITYYFNGGATTDVTIKSYTVEDEGITLPIPTRANHTFGGWYESESFEGGAITVIDTARCENITLYAKWNKFTYTVKFNLNGSDTVIEDQSVEAGGLVTKPEDPIRAGYIFLGWYISDSADEDYKWDFDNDVVEGAITINAIWKIDESSGESGTKLPTVIP